MPTREPIDGLSDRAAAVAGADVGDPAVRREAVGWFRSHWEAVAGLIDQARRSQDDPALARLVQQVAPYLMEIRDWSALAELAGAGAEAAARVRDGEGELQLAQLRGVALQQGDDEAAEHVWEQVAELATARRDERVQSVAFAHLGQLHRRRGDLDGAAGLLRRALLGYEAIGHRVGQARTLGDLASVLYDLGDPDEAARSDRRSLDLFRGAGDRAGEAQALRRVGAGHAERGDWKPALSALSDATALFEELGAVTDAVEARFTAARVHRARGDARTARAVAAAALAAAEATDDVRAGELAEFVAVLEAEEGIDALLAAARPADRDAVAARHPAVLGPLALQMMLVRRGAGRHGTRRYDTALDYLAGCPDGALASRQQVALDEVTRLAGGSTARLSATVLGLVRQLVTASGDEEIDILRRLLDALPAGMPLLRGHLLLRLARAHAGRTGRHPADRSTAVRLAEQAVGVLDAAVAESERAAEEWAGAQVFLGSAYRARGERPHDIEGALASFRRALAVYRRRTHPYAWAATLANLANAYWDRRGPDRRRDLERAVRRHGAALAVYTREDHPAEWAQTQSNLGLVLSDQAFTDDPASLEAAVRHLRRAYESPVLPPEARGAVLLNLSQCYDRRVSGDPDDNRTAALRYAREAFDLFAGLGQPLDMANAASAVAGSLGNREIRSGRDDLDEAVAWYERALALVTPDAAPLLWAGIADNLANALAQRDDGDDLRQAVELNSAALDVYTRHSDPFEEARTCYNLASTLHRIEPPDLDRIIALLERSLVVRASDAVPLEWAESVTELARAKLARAAAGGGTAEIEAVLVLLQPVVAATISGGAPDHARRAWGLLGAAYADLGRWSDAAHAFGQAVNAADRLYRASLLPRGKEAELVQAADLPRLAAYALARSDQPVVAVEVLEGSRARLLGYRLGRDRADLTALAAEHPAAAAAYTAAAIRIRAVEQAQRLAPAGTSEEAGRRMRAEMTDAHAQLDAAITAIRELAAFSGFLADEAGPVLDRAVSSGPPLAYLVTTAYGSVALLVRHGVEHSGGRRLEVDALPGPLTEGELLRVLGMDSTAETALSQLLAVLGDGLVSPLTARLADLGEPAAVLVPTGILGALPVHAARYRRGGRVRHLLDDVDVGYAPSARILVAARDSAGASSLPTARLVGVSEPTPSEPPLPWTRAELATVDRFFGGGGELLSGATATRAELVRALRGASHVHLACHGWYDPADPLDAYLALAGGDRLTLRELFDQRLLDGVRLVVASACDTAVTDMTRLPDEAIGLPAGFLQSGAAAVVGSLWAVNDFSTALVMARFYRNHLRGDPVAGEPPMPVARALARAQTWLRDASAAELTAFAVEAGLLPAAAAAVPAGLARHPFADRPRHWAPFLLVGG